MRRLPLLLIAALAAVPAAAASAAPSLTAAPGRLAVTYDDSRTLSERFGGAVVAPSGGIYAAGNTGKTQRLTITAFAPDGALDRSFGDGGGSIAPWDVRAGGALLRAADGSLLAVGHLPSEDGSFYGPPVVVRAAPDGHFDPAYGGDGVAEVPRLSLAHDDAVLTADGGVLVAGASGRGPDDHRLAVARLRPDGSPDPAFGAGGAAEPVAARSSGHVLLVQPEGRIVVLGSRGDVADPETYRSILVGLRPDGSLDPAFGSAGVVELPANGFDLAQDAAGRLLVLTSERDSGVLRYTPDGVLDPSWGEGGRVDLGRQVLGYLFPTAAGVTVAAAEIGRFRQIHLDAAGRPTAGAVTRLRFGGGAYPRGGMAPVRRGGFYGAPVARRPDGSLVVTGGVDITRGDEGNTIDRAEAGLALIGADGEPAATVASDRPRLRGSIRGARRGRLRVALRPERRGLARMVVRAHGRRIGRRMVPFARARRKLVGVRLNRAGRRLLARRSRMKVTVRVRANDMAGNLRQITRRARL